MYYDIQKRDHYSIYETIRSYERDAVKAWRKLSKHSTDKVFTKKN